MLKAGAQAPPFALTDVAHRRRDSGIALGEAPLVLVFYKVACPTCELTLPKSEMLYQAYGHKLRIWGISQDDRETTIAFARAYGATFPQLLDADDFAVSRQFGITNVPTHYLIDTDGVIISAFAGWDRETMNQLSALLAAKSSVKTPVVVSTPADDLPPFKPG